jgi:hypothetical protein
MNVWQRFKRWFERRFLGYVPAGVYVEEVAGPVFQIEPIDSAFIVARGPAQKPVLIRSFEEWEAFNKDKNGGPT